MDMKITKPELGKPVLKQYTPEEYRLLKEQEAKQVEVTDGTRTLKGEYTAELADELAKIGIDAREEIKDILLEHLNEDALKEQKSKEIEDPFKGLTEEFLKASKETIQVFRASDPDFEANLKALGLSDEEIQGVLKKVHEENSPAGE